MTTVSVVIPAYKAARTICRAVDSVLAQTFSAHEIIVVDDGSPDDVANVVSQAYGDRVVLVRKRNGGAASARNAGIDRATGDLVAFLDADDYWEPEKLARQIAIFERYREVGVVAGRYLNEVPGGVRAESQLPLRTTCDRVLRMSGAAAFRLATRMWTGTVVVRREVLGDERFVSGLEPAEDRDLWARLVSRSGAYLLSTPLATAVLEPGSLSRTNVDRDCANMLRVIERHRQMLGTIEYRRWMAHIYYRWAAIDDSAALSLPRLLKSFAMWPLPFARRELCLPFGRLRRTLALLRSMVSGTSHAKVRVNAETHEAAR